MEEQNANSSTNESMKNTFDKLKEVGKKTFNSENCDKARSLIDKFMFKIYRCAKYVMGAVAAICLIVAIISAAFGILYRSSGIDIPDFDDAKAEFEEENKKQDVTKGDTSKIKKAREIEKNYGDIIEECVQLMGLSGDSAKARYERLKAMLCQIDENEQKAYIKGMRSYISDAVSYSKEKEVVKQNLPFMDGIYHEKYVEAKNDAAIRKRDAAETRADSWGIFTYSLIFLLSSLFLPLLLQIEENTRKSNN